MYIFEIGPAKAFKESTPIRLLEQNTRTGLKEPIRVIPQDIIALGPTLHIHCSIAIVCLK